MLHVLLDLLFYNGTAKTMLAMLAFLYCGEFVKTLLVMYPEVLILSSVHQGDQYLLIRLVQLNYCST